MGAEAAVYAAEASDANDLLERILPATVSDYVDLVKAHIEAGEPRYCFSYENLSCFCLGDTHTNVFRTKSSLCFEAAIIVGYDA